VNRATRSTSSGVTARLPVAAFWINVGLDRQVSPCHLILDLGNGRVSNSMISSLTSAIGTVATGAPCASHSPPAPAPCSRSKSSTVTACHRRSEMQGPQVIDTFVGGGNAY
jgi:hypothetical protein